MNAHSRVMLIDDDPDHQHICGAILRRLGYTVFNLLGCEDLHDMLKWILDFKPDIIFMDHSMPKICGIDATRLLRSYPITKNIPIIYFTGHADIEKLSEEAGADTFLRKPFQQQEMENLLHLYL